MRGTRRRPVAAHIVNLVVYRGVPGERRRLVAWSGTVVAAARVRSPDEAQDVSFQVLHVQGRLKFASFSVLSQFIPAKTN